ncbi:MAG: alpha/beta hydrolase fold domain-containing protein, partial [Verrucomicrobiales bacterium]|nr:alpha/beta hydrolase fold domain-containing protein [Verrucomicrobiales bacterium]
MRLFTPGVFALFLLVPSQSKAQFTYPPQVPGAEEKIYKTVDDVELKMWVLKPDNWSTSDARPAILFFFGGGWKGGSPAQFIPQSQYLAGRGMVAIVVDYRVASRHKTLAKDCVADARDAMRFVRKEAKNMGIDPARIAAGGGSAGGHIAACLGVIDKDPESKPNAMALFNPACVLAPFEGVNYWEKDRSEEMRARMGIDPVALSPVHQVTKTAVPCIIFHGEADSTVPFSTAEIFTTKMKEAGVRCDLMGYPGEG